MAMKETGKKQRGAARGVVLNNSLEKGLRILRLFSSVDEPLRLKDIADLSGLQISAVQRLVYTLHACGMLRKDPKTKLYSPSLNMLDLGFAFLRQDPLVARAMPFLLEASSRCGETINLVEFDGTTVVYVARIPGRYGVSSDVVIGSRFPIYAGAHGQAVLAFLPPGEVDGLLDSTELVAFTPNTITDKQELRSVLETIRERGFASSQEQYTRGDISIAAPVTDRSGYAIGSINLSVQKKRFSIDQAEDRFATIVVETAAAISGIQNRLNSIEIPVRTPPMRSRSGT